jgi:hypothetical protein
MRDPFDNPPKTIEEALKRRGKRREFLVTQAIFFDMMRRIKALEKKVKP